MYSMSVTVELLYGSWRRKKGKESDSQQYPTHYICAGREYSNMY
jgi:hypothetical protein